SFNVPSARGTGVITIEKGGRKAETRTPREGTKVEHYGGEVAIEQLTGTTEARTFTVTGGMCPRCEGMGSVTDIDLSQLYDDTKSLNDGALTIPGYTADGWQVRI